MFSKFRSPKFLVYLPFIFFGITFIFLASESNAPPTASSLFSFGMYYFALTITPLRQAVAWLLAFCLLVILFRTCLLLVYGWRKKIDPFRMFTISYLKDRSVALLHETREALAIAIPLVAILVLSVVSLGEASGLLKSHLKDDLLLRWDFYITKTIPFLSLQGIHYPSLFISSVIFSYSHLAATLIFLAFYLFYKHRAVLQEFAGAFSMGLIIMLPVWYALPALTPQDRYIDNVYHLPLPAIVESALGAYHPEKKIVLFFQNMRDIEGDLNDVPISTMPSAHIAWAVFAGYYAFRARRAIGFLILPLLLLSSFGTVFLAQHYFVDVLGGVIVAVLTIFITSLFFPPTAVERPVDLA